VKETKYRICKNKYGYYVIQKKVFNSLFRKKWITYSALRFIKKEYAVHHVLSLKKEDEKYNSDWVECEEIK